MRPMPDSFVPQRARGGKWCRARPGVWSESTELATNRAQQTPPSAPSRPAIGRLGQQQSSKRLISLEPQSDAWTRC